MLDPVGIGIGSLRTQLIEAVRENPPAILRGNASEIIAVAELWGLGDDAAEDASGDGPRGVDSTDSVDAAERAAVACARFTGGAVAVSGTTDLVTDGAQVARLSGGSPLMTCITGSGCSLGGVCAVYACVADPFVAALAATAAYNLAGLRAAETYNGSGSFQVAFLDALYNLTAEGSGRGTSGACQRISRVSRETKGDSYEHACCRCHRPLRRGRRAGPLRGGGHSRHPRLRAAPPHYLYVHRDRGRMDEVMAVVRDATMRLADQGIRTEVILKADIRPEHSDTLHTKVEKVEALLTD